MKEVFGKCLSCLGCNREKLEQFNGTYRCENYIYDGRGEKECQENLKK